jgi:hypothetical protein
MYDEKEIVEKAEETVRRSLKNELPWHDCVGAKRDGAS